MFVIGLYQEPMSTERPIERNFRKKYLVEERQRRPWNSMRLGMSRSCNSRLVFLNIEFPLTHKHGMLI